MPVHLPAVAAKIGLGFARVAIINYFSHHLSSNTRFFHHPSYAMKNLFTLLVISILPSFLFSQKTTIVKGALLEEDVYRTSVQEMCKYNDGAIGLIRESYKKKGSDEPDYYIEKFDANLKRISSNLVKTPVLGGGEPNVFSIHPVADHFCVFWYEKLKKSDNATLYYSILNNEGLATDIKKLTDMPLSDNFIKKWATYLSEDQKTWAVKKIILDKKTNVTKIEIECFDAALNLKWKQEYIPFKDGETSTIGDLTLGNGGYMAMLVTDWNTNKKMEKKISQEIWVCDENGVSKTVPLIAPQGYAVTHARFGFTENRIDMWGIYADTDQKKKILNPADYGAVGTFQVSLNKPDYKTLVQEFTLFPKSIFEYFIAKEKDFEDGIIGMFISNLITTDMSITYLVLDNENGSMYVSGNKMHNSINSSTGLAVSYQNGQLQKHVLLPKAMHSDDERAGLGFLSQKTGETIHFLYNDGPKNRKLKLSDELEEFGESPMSTTNALVKKKADVMRITLGSSGNPEKHFVLGYKESDIFLNHLISLSLDHDSFIYITGIDGKYQLNKFTYDK